MRRTRPIIPRFEPEIVACEARRRYFGDDEKAATTSIKSLEFEGVLLSSRYDKADEYEYMVAIVEGVSCELRRFIDSVFCDSKCSYNYIIQLKSCSRSQARAIASEIEASCLLKQGGHNGISLEGRAGGSLFIDPDWEIRRITAP
jgi:hypothetical protein